MYRAGHADELDCIRHLIPCRIDTNKTSESSVCVLRSLR